MNKLEVLTSLKIAEDILLRLPSHIPYMLTVMDNTEISLDIAPSTTLDLWTVAEILEVTSVSKTDEIQRQIGALTVTAYLEPSLPIPPYLSPETEETPAFPPADSCARCLRQKELHRRWSRAHRNTGRPAGRPRKDA